MEQDNVVDLNETEQQLKALFEAHRSLDLTTPHPMRYFFDILPEYAAIIADREGAFPTGAILTESPFLHGTDIALNRHLRYMPPFLHAHTFFETIYVAAGSCVNHINGSDIEMTAGNVCIIAPYVEHALTAFSDDAIIGNLLMRSSTFFQTILNILPKDTTLYAFFYNTLNSNSKNSYILFRSPEDEQIRDGFHHMAEAYFSREPYHSNMVNLLSGLFFVQLLSRYERTIVVSDSLDRHLQDFSVVRIFRYISEHLQSLSLSELADHFGYSERQMARILKTYTGKNYTELVRLERLSKACELMKNPDIPITDIAWMVGYPNFKYFYRLFCKQYQKTPAQYRREILHPDQ